MIITSAGDPSPASCVRPLAFGSSANGYDRKKYLELLLWVAETMKAKILPEAGASRI
jgi:hypothetical protein